ncbi:ATP-dependent helicase [Mycetocola tolaasinivorans]|uniref:DNA 3'-5' helicase n=1 Tax=Mycetocola tolaasinivorans TaxID=76635 RepID=A0A3L7A8S4_9MICO|nr:ATP-dependent DNA helicase [Mycetocola tolaasinivorans]RLP76464.1 ATP-dependent helicase [Mycetocola tolaasinivorans]
MTAFSTPATFSALEIAAILDLPTPTAEQIAVIEAPLEPALVVAGAGSGKTETMANRIVWLLANSHVRVSEILGLTFTRKAAGELAERVHERITELRQALAERGVQGVDIDVLEAPTISTYNAFASGIFREYAALIGREADATVIGEASAWALARRVLIESSDPRLIESSRSLPALVQGVLRISRGMSDNDAREHADRIVNLARDFEKLTELPINDAAMGTRKRGPNKDLVAAATDIGELPMLVELAEEYAARKRSRGFIEFSDQVALALEIVRTLERVPTEYCARYRVVILDEYQDTSVVQTELLSRLFGGHGVMAVGDPNQSIYGWRGASAANLARFSRDFSVARTAGYRPADTAARYTLSTSWRNPGLVLKAANTLVGKLPAAEGVPVKTLVPASFAGDGAVSIAFEQTVEDEAERVAEWFVAELERPRGDKQRSAALLCRSLKKVDPFLRALEARGVPYHVLGLAGLLDQPVIVDLVCALRVLHDPSAGSELIRLLAGGRFRIGPRDLRALGNLASWLGERDHRLKRVSKEVREKRFGSADAEDNPSLVDALDFLDIAADDHPALADITPEGRARMRKAARLFTSLRRRAGLGLHEYVGLVSRELDLDLESAANEHQVLAGPSLEAFAEQITSFLQVDETGTIGAFLEWLEQAEQHENLSPRGEEPEPGTVQVLTIHGAKGLEWDSVAVPRMVAGEMPGTPRSRRGWTAFGELPYEFRGDYAELPDLAWRGLESQPEFETAYAAFGEQIDTQHSEEQRRLAYVAVTRSKDALLLSGSFWAAAVKPREPGVYLREIAGKVDTAWSGDDRYSEPDLPTEPLEKENPRTDQIRSLVWPRDPLGTRRTAVTAAAAAVRAASPVRISRASENGSEPLSEDARNVDLLLAERERLLRGEDSRVELPARIPASRFKDFVIDPIAVAGRIARPVPERPYRQTRLGTLFHDWVEHRAGIVGSQETIDAAAWERDDEELGGTLAPVAEAEREHLERLQETFLRSEWADLAPIAVEIEINYRLRDKLIICKLDAVYEREGRIQIVDWKTGKAPRSNDELRERQYQLALYREGYARFTGTDPRLIDAVFYYVADDRVIRPESLSDAIELESAWENAVAIHEAAGRP